MCSKGVLKQPSKLSFGAHPFIQACLWNHLPPFLLHVEPPGVQEADQAAFRVTAPRLFLFEFTRIIRGFKGLLKDNDG